MKEIIDGLKKILIPIVIGLISYPLLSILQYKGIIIKSPVVTSKDILVYNITSTNSDPYNVIIITFTLSDTLRYSIGNERMFLSPIPRDINWANSSVSRYGNSTGNSRSIIIRKIFKGNYILEIPLVFKSADKLFNKEDGIIVFREKKDPNGLPVPFSDIKVYQWYFWIFFHPWWTSFILFFLSLIIQIIISRYKKKKL